MDKCIFECESENNWTAVLNLQVGNYVTVAFWSRAVLEMETMVGR